MRRRYVQIAIVSILFKLMDVNSAIALNETTHAIINEQAARQSRPNKPGLDQILKDELGFPQGIEESLRSREVFEWLREGGIQEDSPLCRTARHFHDPLQPWENAGLRTLNPIIMVPCGGSSFLSSVHWAQKPNQSVGKKWSWQDARLHYLRALTASDPGTREQAFADTFQAIGQQMHLVVDASVIEHVRNDPHLLESALRAVGQRGYGSYEHWVSDQHGPPGSSREQNFITSYLSNPVNFDSAILQQPTNDSKSPVSIARLIDTDTYTGLASGPNVTKNNPAIGIAEFANANFFSEDTQPGQYPFPDINSVVPSSHPAPKTGRARAYYKKGPNDGVQGDPVLAECVLDQAAIEEGIVDPFIYTCTDENVWAQTAREMLPRAVSYAGGVLDYFFRGTLDFTVSASSSSANQNGLTITNTSAEAMDGIFTLYADNFSEVRSSVQGASFNLTLGPGTTSGPLSFTPPSQVQAYVLVFQGRLGIEDDAVAGKINKWYTVTNVTPGKIIPGQPSTLTVTIKSNFRQTQTLVAALFDGNATHLASTAVIIQNTAPTTTKITLDITSTTIPTNAPRPISVVIAADVDMSSITTTDVNAKTPVNVIMNLVRVGQNSRLPIYLRGVSGELMQVAVGPGHFLFVCPVFGVNPEMVTLKYNNVKDFFIQYLSADDDFDPQLLNQGIVLNGSQTQFQTITLKLDTLVDQFGNKAVNHFLQGRGDLVDANAFVCIRSISELSKHFTQFGFGICDIGTRDFKTRECPE